MKVSDTIQISAPLNKVFNAFTDLKFAEKHISGIRKIEVLSGEEKLQEGTQWRETRLMFGKEATEDMTVTELVQNERYAVEAESNGVHYKTEYIFEELPHTVTEVAVTFEGVPLTKKAKIYNTIFSVFGGKLKKMLHKDMEDLKKILE